MRASEQEVEGSSLVKGRDDADLDSEKSSVISGDEEFDDPTRTGLIQQHAALRGLPENRMLASRASSSGIQERNNRRTPATQASQDPGVISWRDLPRKDQLVVITLARLSEPLVQTSLQVRQIASRHNGPSLQLTYLPVVHVLHAEMVQPGLVRLGYI